MKIRITRDFFVLPLLALATFAGCIALAEGFARVVVQEDLLDTWPGTLIVVSHDRYLLERVTDQQFALIGGKIRHLPGGVADYLAMTEAIKAGRDPFAGDAASGHSSAW